MATKSKFPGFSPAGIQFLHDLKENNDREWFTPRKPLFDEQVRLPMIDLVRAVHGEMMRFAPGYVGDAAKCVFRIYRDTRFSNDKTPYKTHIAAWMKPVFAGKGDTFAGFYFSVSATTVEIAAGTYAPDPPTLLKLRQRIAEDHDQYRETFSSPAFRKVAGVLMSESLTRAPKGFDPGHPAIDLIRLKHHVVFKELDSAVAITPKLLPEIVRRFELMVPFVEYLNGALRPVR
ncbi:MAG: hypothetical protein JWN34_4205 [Bryobacterales bacterium]|jgi:uncharacterized protein (TIGR02453 family)|nr:hypothetical protein [Bryobacterales bacterium]